MNNRTDREADEIIDRRDVIDGVEVIDLLGASGERRTRITYAWHADVPMFFIGLFSLLWLGIMAAATPLTPDSRIAKTLLVLSYAPSFLMAWVFFRSLLNRTTIDVTSGELILSHGPWTTKKGATIERSTIERIELEREESDDIVTWSLHVKLTDATMLEVARTSWNTAHAVTMEALASTLADTLGVPLVQPARDPRAA